jgi:hypothetical protein
MLADRDEILVAGQRIYFSTETLAAVEEHAGPVLRCPRCKREIAPGAKVVRCPRCKALHHEACWTYSEACTLCPAPTALDAGFQWTPEGL